MERHRIQELFSEEVLNKIKAITTSTKMHDNNQKVKALLFLLKGLGFTEIGPGTNRLVVRNVDYVYKIAMDSYGVRDNWNEFNMGPRLQPYVTKTYECNGLVAVAEYVNLINREEFIDSKEQIRNILDCLSEDYIFCDMSLTLKNMLNYGYRDNGEIVILDYGYIYPIDRKIMFCLKCGGRLKWKPDYTALTCTKCGKVHDPITVRDRMWMPETSFVPHKREDPDDKDEGLTIKL